MNQSWKPLTKIAFRFFFVFFALEILLAMDIPTLMLGMNMTIMMFGQKIFTPPFLWLNETVFHFHYNPWTWWTFTFSLMIIRFIVFLFIALIACILWTLLDRKRLNYNRLDFWLRTVLWICLSGVMWGYGISKIFPVQMQMPDLIDLQQPVGKMSPFSLLWTMMGYGTPYQIFTGISEALGAILIIFRRTRLVGLLILFAVLCNVVVINYTYVVGVIHLSSFLLCMTIYLLIPYLGSMWYFFFTDKPANQFANLPQFTFTTPWKKFAITIIGAGVLGTTYILDFTRNYSRYNKDIAINESKKFYEVKNFVVDSDTLKNLVEGDSVRWRFWSESALNNQTTVTLHTMKSESSKSYSLMRDSLAQKFTLKPNGGTDTIPIILTYRNLGKTSMLVQGSINGNSIYAELQQIDPVSELKLLQFRRKLFETDREVWW